jgi:hypothetical protein
MLNENFLYFTLQRPSYLCVGVYIAIQGSSSLSQPAQAWVQVFLYPLLPFWSRKLCIYSSSGQVYIKSLLFSPSWALSESIFHCWIVNGNGFLLLRFQRQVLSFKIYTECQFLRCTPNDRGIISTLWMLQDIVLIKRYWQLVFQIWSHHSDGRWTSNSFGMSRHADW